MNNTIFIKEYTSEDLPINEREVWRYAGYMGLPAADDELVRIYEQVKNELADAFTYKICYLRQPLEWDKSNLREWEGAAHPDRGDESALSMPRLPFDSKSKGLAECLAGSTEVLLFAATIGLEIDRHIARCGRFAPAKALLMQGFGAERVESLCNKFCQDIAAQLEKKQTITARFSPGYGDLPLETQKEFFKLLDCNRKIGLSLNDSLLMTPSKSVTAVFGIRPISDKEEFDNCNQAGKHNCSKCNLTDCDFRSEKQE